MRAKITPGFDPREILSTKASTYIASITQIWYLNAARESERPFLPRGNIPTDPCRDHGPAISPRRNEPAIRPGDFIIVEMRALALFQVIRDGNRQPGDRAYLRLLYGNGGTVSTMPTQNPCLYQNDSKVGRHIAESRSAQGRFCNGVKTENPG